MQDRYVGDAGDFGKYSLLNAVSVEQKLGVAWYLFPDEGHNADGKYVGYLDRPHEWRAKDPEAFDILSSLVAEGRRNTLAVQESGLLGEGTVFSRRSFPSANLVPSARSIARQEWFAQTRADLEDCEIVFADPDNGLERVAGFRIQDSQIGHDVIPYL